MERDRLSVRKNNDGSFTVVQEYTSFFFRARRVSPVVPILGIAPFLRYNRAMVLLGSLFWRPRLGGPISFVWIGERLRLGAQPFAAASLVRPTRRFGQDALPAPEATSGPMYPGMAVLEIARLEHQANSDVGKIPKIQARWKKIKKKHLWHLVRALPRHGVGVRIYRKIWDHYPEPTYWTVTRSEMKRVCCCGPADRNLPIGSLLLVLSHACSASTL